MGQNESNLIETEQNKNQLFNKLKPNQQKTPELSPKLNRSFDSVLQKQNNQLKSSLTPQPNRKKSASKSPKPSRTNSAKNLDKNFVHLSVSCFDLLPTENEPTTSNNCCSTTTPTKNFSTTKIPSKKNKSFEVKNI